MRLWLCFSLAICITLCTVNARHVHVDVKSSGWPRYSLSDIAETAEAVSEHSPPSFWLYVEELCKHSERIDSLSSDVSSGTSNSEAMAELQTIAMDAAQAVTPSSLHSLMGTSLGVGSYTPAVRFFQAISESFGNPCNGGAFIVTYPGGEISCTAFTASSRSSSSSSGINDIASESDAASWDHIYDPAPSSSSPSSASTSSPSTYLGIKAVLYGAVGSSSFCNLHKSLVPMATSGQIKYSARHAFPGLEPVTRDMRLQGYGVFLDIKNMEYKNFDDSKPKAASSGPAGDAGNSNEVISFPEGEEIGGIIFSKLLERHPSLSGELNMLREELIEKTAGSSDSMKVWKMKDLGLQALQSIMTTTHTSPVNRLEEIAQNFPMHASSLSSVKVNPDLRNTVLTWWQSNMQNFIPPNSVFINGLRLDLAGNTFNVYDLLQEVRDEIRHMEKLSSLSLPVSLRNELQALSKNVGAGDKDAQAMGGGIVRVDISKGCKYVVAFVNNLEKDTMYKRWPKTLQQLLYPSWSLNTIAKNLYTTVANIDLMSEEGAMLAYQIQTMWQQQYPVRFGLVVGFKNDSSQPGPQSNMLSSIDAARLFAFAKDTHGHSAAVSFAFAVARNILEAAQTGAAEAPFISKDEAIKIFALSVGSSNRKLSSKVLKEQASNVLSDPSVSMEALHNTTEYLSARGLDLNSFSLNGIVRNTADLGNGMMQLLGREQYIVTQLFQKKMIHDKTKSIFNVILEDGKAFPRFHPLLEERNPSYVDAGLHQSRSLLSQLAPFFFSNMQAVSAKGRLLSSAANTTIVRITPSLQAYASAAASLRWLRSTLESDQGDVGAHRLAIIFSLSDALEACEQGMCLQGVSEDEATEYNDVITKVAFVTGAIEIVCSSDCNSKASISTMETVFEVLASGGSINMALDALSGNFPDKAADLKKKIFGGVDELATLYSSAVQFSRLSRSYGNMASSSAIVYNGRTVVAKDKPVHQYDLDLLASIEHGRLGRNLEDAVARVLLNDEGSNMKLSDVTPDLMFSMSSFCGRYSSISGRRTDVSAILAESAADGGLDFSPLTLKIQDVGNNKEFDSSSTSTSMSDISIYYVIDPLSTAAQRAASLIKLIHSQLHIPQTVLLIPRPEVTEFPLQNFYRFVLSSYDQENAVAVFRNLPRQHTLTVRIDAPEPWNIQASSASQDIDNLRCDGEICGDIGSASKDTTSISYALKNILVAGQCFETKDMGMPPPPNGLQLVLLHTQPNVSSTSSSSLSVAYPSADTLVMQNLGYFQLQANPGLWSLNLAAGRASDLFNIIDTAGKPVNSISIAVRSFADMVHRVNVKKRPGMEDVPLLLEEGKSSNEADSKGVTTNSGGGILSSITSLFGSPSPSPSVVADKNETIHVFSLATGHMYERLLRIMMLSVTKRTSSPVKFWLFENYLSPTFKASAAAMANEYGFELGYVTYKWPEWLTQQTQKQRIIWGYKILFLDVLFPLNVKKVIYVDADQVVRADLKELWDLDLQGKPYAYTPFCDSREETLGFQFWRQGYWADHLRGKPYHISALYVVDLQRFRRFAVGDQLRAVYDGLARDPNSLANLDQDLPNYAQHSVPIHSLPQEWLWCETWCSDASKKEAKTIDLCNNPLHKEPKLDMARRVISGDLFAESWVSLDNEISSFLKNKGLQLVD